MKVSFYYSSTAVIDLCLTHVPGRNEQLTIVKKQQHCLFANVMRSERSVTLSPDFLCVKYKGYEIKFYVCLKQRKDILKPLFI